MPDLSGRTVVVTGANSGIGYEATRAFASRGATVIMACRSTERGEEAKAEIAVEATPGVLDVRECDLGSLSSVRSFAEGVRADYDDLHALCNNAGVMAIPRSETEDGFETQFGVNHLGHVALTGYLLGRLIDTDGETRVVTQSSGVHTAGRIDFDDLQREEGYEKWRAYAQSKLANLLFAYELERRLDRAGIDGVTSVACHPGYADTNLQFRGAELEGSTLKRWGMRLANALLAQSPAKGALPLLYAATAAEISGGEYVGPGGLMNVRGAPEIQRSSNRSYDEDVAERLWAVSEDLTGVAYEFQATAVPAES